MATKLSRHYILYFILLFSLLSCNQTNRKTPIAYHTQGVKWKEYVKNCSLGGPDSLIEYYKNGQIKAIDQLYNIPKDSDAYYISKAGTVEIKGKYNNGYYYLFDSVGSLRRKSHIKIGKMDGMQYEYYPNGQIQVSYNYEDGLLNGEQNEYSNNGTLLFTGNFLGQIPIRGAIYYDSSGRILRYSYFNDQGQVIYIRRYDSMGNVVKEEGDSTIVY